MTYLLDISSYTQQFGSFLIALLGFLFFSKRDLPIKVLAIYGINSVVFEALGQIIFYFRIKGVLNLRGNIYTLTELFILLFFFHTVFVFKFYKKATVIFAIVYLLLYFIFMYNRWTEIPSSIRTMRDVILIICSLLYFYTLLKDMPSINIVQYPMFWIVVGFLFLFAGTFSLSLSIDYWVKTLGNDWGWFWVVRNFFRFACCLVVCYGLWLDLQSVKEKSV